MRTSAQRVFRSAVMFGRHVSVFERSVVSLGRQIPPKGTKEGQQRGPVAPFAKSFSTVWLRSKGAKRAM